MRRTILLLALLALAAFATLADSRFSYVFKRGDKSVIAISDSIEHVAKISKKYSGDFLWVRRNGREWVLRDPQVLAAADAAFREVDAFEPTLRAAENKLRPFESRMEALEKRMDAISDTFDDETLSEAAENELEAKLHDIEQQIRTLESQMRPLEEAVERAEAILDEREERAERELLRIIEKAIRR